MTDFMPPIEHAQCLPEEGLVGALSAIIGHVEFSLTEPVCIFDAHCDNLEVCAGAGAGVHWYNWVGYACGHFYLFDEANAQAFWATRLEENAT
jgi:hypothetical protein